MRNPTDYYYRERRKGRMLAVVLHVLVLVLMFFGLPSFLQPDPPLEPAAITVELLPITGITNVKPSEQTPSPEPKPQVKPEPKKPEPKKEPEKPKEAENKKPTPPVKTAEPPPPPPPPEPKKEPEKPKKETVEKKPEPKKEEQKNKAKEEDLAAVLKAVKEQAQKANQAEKPKEATTDGGSPSKSISNQYNPDLPMSLSERDAIMSQLAKCWSVPAGVKDAQNLVVLVNAEYNPDGTYLKVELSRESRAQMNNPTYRAAADAAVRAVKMCSPLQGLPPEKFQTWRLMELRFDPKFMLN